VDHDHRRLTLLIADDDVATRTVLAMSLSFAFDVVGQAGDADAAVELARETRPDAALVDVNMPEGGARRAVPGIVAASPATAIVALSVDESDSLVRELLIAGAVAYMRKGTDPRELAEALRRAITVRAGEHSAPD
jgi:two-component system nitrate/nitrite response regulator NarL